MAEPLVSVAIMNEAEISIILEGEFKCCQSESTFSGHLIAKYHTDRIIIQNGNKIINTGRELHFSPVDPGCSFTLEGVTIGVNFHWEQKETQKFNGSLKIIIENNKLTAVNILPVEDYLTSVISSEMSATCSMDLLKAHAIISRSWLLAQLDKTKKLKDKAESYKTVYENDEEYIKWYDREDHTLYDVCADDHCQRYQGITKQIKSNPLEAVKATRGLVLTYDGNICDARFSKSCGGISENFENVWEVVEHPYLKRIIDNDAAPEGFKLDLTIEENAVNWIKGEPAAFCNTKDAKILSQVLLNFDQTTTDFYRWKVEYSQNEIAELIKTKSGRDFGKIIDLIPVERGESGRLIKLKVIGTEKSLIIGKELEIRRTLSKSHLYSSAFYVEKSEINGEIPGKFTLYGAGWGHGVGLCQIGAAVMGEKGYAYQDILLHYFKNASLTELY